MEGTFFLIPAQCEITSRMKMCCLTSETCSRDEILMLADGSSKHLEMLAWWMITGLYLHWRLKCWTRFMAAPLKRNICDCTRDSQLMSSMSWLLSKERPNTRVKPGDINTLWLEGILLGTFLWSCVFIRSLSSSVVIPTSILLQPHSCCTNIHINLKVTAINRATKL